MSNNSNVKIYAPLGYTLTFESGRDWLDGSNIDEVRDFVLNMAEWSDASKAELEKATLSELIKTLTDNGYEVVNE